MRVISRHKYYLLISGFFLILTAHSGHLFSNPLTTREIRQKLIQKVAENGRLHIIAELNVEKINMLTALSTNFQVKRPEVEASSSSALFDYELESSILDVAYRVIHPEMPIKPGIVKVPLKIKSPFARAMLANSITMTPGTITVDIVDDNIYVHWIYIVSGDPVEYTKKVSGRFEHYIKKIFE